MCLGLVALYCFPIHFLNALKKTGQIMQEQNGKSLGGKFECFFPPFSGQKKGGETVNSVS